MKKIILIGILFFILGIILFHYYTQIEEGYSGNDCKNAAAYAGIVWADLSLMCRILQKAYSREIDSCKSSLSIANISSASTAALNNITNISWSDFLKNVGDNDVNNAINNLTTQCSSAVATNPPTSAPTTAPTSAPITATTTSVGITTTTSPPPSVDELYANAVSGYKNAISNYITTTTIDTPQSQLISWEQALDSQFDNAIAGYTPQTQNKTVYNNLSAFDKYANSLFDSDCTDPTTRLDNQGIYTCFASGSNNQLKQLQSSCQSALLLASSYNDNSPAVSNVESKCKNFIQNNLTNTVGQVNTNLQNLMMSSNQLIQQYEYSSQLLADSNNQVCKQNDPIVAPITTTINDTLTLYNENIGPYLDGLINELTDIKDNLPNSFSIKSIGKGIPGSLPYIEITPIDKLNNQMFTFTVPQGKQGAIGPTGPKGPDGLPGPRANMGAVGSQGIWEVPVQYQSIF